MSRLLARLGVVVAAGSVLLLGGGPAALAHVTASATDAAAGGFAEIAFRVPTESDTASTVKLQVAFPADTPIGSVSVLPHPGWTYQVTRSGPAMSVHGGEARPTVGQIEWTASTPDAAVKPGEYEVFRVSAGPLPQADQVVFKVVQTYDDGQVVRWIETPSADGSKPEHPAPVLSLAGSAGEHGVATVASVEPVAGAGTPVTTWLAMAALVAALGAVLLSLRAVDRRRGTTTPG